jgi:hypothetical protein
MQSILLVEISPSLMAEDNATLRLYLTDPFRLSDAQWQRLRAAIDKLSSSVVVFGGRRYRFKRFYDAFINGTYAYPFLQRLSALDNLEREGAVLQADIARKIVAWLHANGILPATVAGAEYLIVYCLYWWAAFARGYLFEQAVVRDLQAAGIRFQAHRAEHSADRYAPFDLWIPGLGHGDVKASIFFLDDLPDPPADFYVTRLYDSEQRRSRQIVFSTPLIWRRIDGEPKRTSLTGAVRVFPDPASVDVVGRPWIVVEYEVWKARVRRWQLRGN